MLYVHVPFCKQACHYCDFHFSTSLRYKGEMVDALIREIEIRHDYLKDKNLQSIYFGGGSPSILETADIARIIEQAAKYFSLAEDIEITLEANPDDLTQRKVTELRRQTPVNRFSIGIQSFFEEDLRWMNRAHTSEEAETVIKRVQDAGFDNLTCDLIYGFPLLTDEKWMHNINRLIQQDIRHISSYAMTVEENTALHHFVKKGKTRPMDDRQMATQFLMLLNTLEYRGYEQYEISNFAKDGCYARHNTNYWKGVHYLGIGPSAHSFDGDSRMWNVRNNALYIAGLQQGEIRSESERLSEEDKLNEYIMTSLRTIWGVDLGFITEKFGDDIAQSVKRKSAKYILSGKMLDEGARLVLTKSGKLFADLIASELFMVGE